MAGKEMRTCPDCKGSGKETGHPAENRKPKCMRCGGKGRIPK